jgi:hypothetical protein
MKLQNLKYPLIFTIIVSCSLQETSIKANTSDSAISKRFRREPVSLTVAASSAAISAIVSTSLTLGAQKILSEIDKNDDHKKMLESPKYCKDN